MTSFLRVIWDPVLTFFIEASFKLDFVIKTSFPWRNWFLFWRIRLIIKLKGRLLLFRAEWQLFLFFIPVLIDVLHFITLVLWKKLFCYLLALIALSKDWVVRWHAHLLIICACFRFDSLFFHHGKRWIYSQPLWFDRVNRLCRSFLNEFLNFLCWFLLKNVSFTTRADIGLSANYLILIRCEMLWFIKNIGWELFYM